MSELKRYLTESTEKLEIKLDGESIERFEAYYNLLAEWNNKINLTAITDPMGVAVKHFADSLSVLKYADITDGAKVIDVGTGAGFPGIPLLIFNNKIKLTLLDSLNKRLVFLQCVLDELGLSAEVIHSRAEDGARKPELRESYDFAVSRAVAGLDILSEYCLPYVKRNGVFVAMKGFDCDEELENAKPMIKALGGKISSVDKFYLPDGSGRAVIQIKKVNFTPKQYPRPSAKIAKAKK